MNRLLNILHLEDEPDFARLIHEILEKSGLSNTTTLLSSYDDFVRALETIRFDLILCDFQLPNCNGLQALRTAREKAPATPFVLLSGVLGEEAAIETLKSGANDYVLKSSLNRLVPSVERALREAEERKQAHDDLAKAQAELMHVSRLAGMAEAATTVLHNVGNVLTSVNISVNLVSDELRKSKIASLSRVAGLLREHENDLANFIANDPQGRQVSGFLSKLAEHLTQEQTALMKEMEQIQKNVDHIKEIVSIQQNYSKTLGSTETLRATDLVEDALRMSAGSLQRHEVKIARDYDSGVPNITIQKHKALQILVNLIRNAKYACDETNKPEKLLTLRVKSEQDRVKIIVADNGVGIPAENFAKIFNYGFTTRKEGHGFGLHSSVLVAKEMGGELRAHSDGPGQGATFTLELPVNSK